ncbi:MAG: methylmalonyl Co-A mutase-associated GTPase MeaB [Flavobacteriales bacterium]|nr:methylmalonyl Co-A mutase-associated GTPase MeaB [Flavobacteriales bacterium]
MSQPIDIAELAQKLITGDRVALGKAITLVESTREEQQLQAAELLELCAPHAIESKRIGITGVPGVGKSTFIDAFGSKLTESGRKVAVLAVDPSSGISHGSILGDKTRMEKLSSNPNAFIRPTPSSGSLGGVARKTRETITLCEAAGFDTILIETVGVGQSETAVHSMVDMFVLLVLATAGDELQGIKRGIMEMADLVIINKDDGENASYTKLAKASYHQALHMFPAKESGWIVPVISCSSLSGNGIEEILNSTESYFKQVRVSGYFLELRLRQIEFWLEATILDELARRFYSNTINRNELRKLKGKINSDFFNPYLSAVEIVSNWLNRGD